MNVLARIISILFHPLLLATYLFGFFSQVLPSALDAVNSDDHLNFLLLIFCITFVFPALNIGIFKTFGTIRTITMEERRERIVPFTFIAILYCLTTYLLYTRTYLTLYDNALKFLIIIDLLVVLATLITYFYKVSVHSLAMWGLVGILLPLNKVTEDGSLFYPTLIAIALAGLVMSARLQLQAHKPREVLVGALVGFAASFSAMIFLFQQ